MNDKDWLDEYTENMNFGQWLGLTAFVLIQFVLLFYWILS